MLLLRGSQVVELLTAPGAWCYDGQEGVLKRPSRWTAGLPHAITSIADVTDRAGALARFAQRRPDLNRVR